MTKILFSILFLAVVFTANSRQLNKEEALLRAAKFEISSENTNLRNSKVNNGSVLKLEYIKEYSNHNLYYVFNKGVNQGYIIVSGDDRANEILGYTDSGTFDVDNLPENMKSWLQMYSDELTRLAQTPDTKAAKTTYSSTKEYAPSIAPLLRTLAWNQDSPYNDMCPSLPNGRKAAAGCVATAVSQVMYYNQWPPRGTGSYSYISETHQFELSANFDTEYEWSKMTPTYDNNSSEESRKAVAKLLYHVGVAFDMNYGEESGAFSSKTAEVLSTYFKYDAGMETADRNIYELNDWIDLLKNELNQKRVFVYTGVSSDGAHAFVCDGYDQNNMFHINWGWGGMSNGYFQATALTPSSQGIGGGSAEGFNRLQSVVIGIQKETPAPPIKKYSMTYSDVTTQEGEYNRNATVSFTVNNLYNISNQGINGLIGFGLYRGDEFITSIGTENINLSPGYGSDQLTINVTIPPTVAAGEYKAYPIFKTNDSDEYVKAISTIGDGLVKDINVTVGSKIKYSNQIGVKSILTLSNMSVSKIYVGKECVISCDITNTGAEYYADITPKLLDNNNKVVSAGEKNLVNIRKGETLKLKFGALFDAPQGNYKLGIFDRNDEIIGNAINVVVNPTPADPNLIIIEPFHFQDDNNVPKDKFKISVKVKNSGGYFTGKLDFIIYGGTTGSYVTQLPSENVLIDNNETAEIEFNNTLSLDNGRYIGAISYYKAGTYVELTPKDLNRIEFTLTDPSGVNDIESITTAVYPNPVTETLNISSEKEISSIRIHDVAGRFISEQHIAEPTTIYSLDMSSFEPGNYFIQIVTSDGIKVERVIKK